MAVRVDPKSEMLELLRSGDKEATAARAAVNKRSLATLIDGLSGDDRQLRIAAARAVHALAIAKPEALKGFGAELADALDRPEAQTRWEVLAALEKIVATDARVADKAIESAMAAVHDAESGVVRLAAFRLLTAYGATTARRSERVWPIVDEAIRVYHGDPEFLAMLIGVIRLVSGDASDEVRLAAAERMSFDAEHGKGLLGKRAKRIQACAPKNGRAATVTQTEG